MRIVVLALLLLCAAAHPARAEAWYNGGTLQKAAAPAWRAGTPADRLATAADLLAAFNGITDISKLQPADLEKFRGVAVILEACISKNAESAPPEAGVAALALQCFMSAEKSQTGMPE